MALEQHRAVALLPTAAVANGPQEGDGAESSHANSDIRQELQNMRLVVDIGNGTIEVPLKGRLVLQNYCGSLHETPAAGDSVRVGGGDGYLDNMRGWLLTVATLFVGMAFQAATQPPAWIPKDWLDTLLANKHFTAGAIISREEAVMALAYLFFNTVTFSMALTLVVLLLVMEEKSTRGRMCLLLARGFGVKLAVAVSCSFAVGISGDSRVLVIVFAIMAMYALCAVLLLWVKGATFLGILSSRGARRG